MWAMSGCASEHEVSICADYLDSLPTAKFDRAASKASGSDLLQGRRMLYYAAVLGREERLRDWLIQDPSEAIRDAEIIMHSAGAGQVGAVKLLLNAGVGANVRDTNGSTPLMAAVFCDRYNVAKLLIMRGADVNARNDSSSDAMITAVLGGNSRMVRLLLDNGFDLARSTTRNGSTPESLALKLGHADIEAMLRMRKGPTTSTNPKRE
jgi:ankyrin repeat protein